ncbi:MAG: hypothetical protein DRP86_01265 [Candidatus Neomarinimicrobiota bacterium]|nr:MAG: hypothetical protein DRP86_01265 [Candidatus Neomarinimicrobiota bacterium]
MVAAGKRSGFCLLKIPQKIGQPLSLIPGHSPGRRVMINLKEIHGNRILDIACGGGHTAVELCGELKSRDHVTGIDIRCRLREEFLKKFPEKKATFIAGDVRKTPADCYGSSFVT